jgi:Gpi18-like mannosyltransferase
MTDNHSPQPTGGDVVPKWVRTADWAALLFLVLAVSVLVFGGFREYIGTLRISVRSSDRLVVIGLAIIAARHLIRPRPNLMWTLINTTSAIRASAAWRTAIAAFLGTRVVILVVGYFAVVTIGSVPGTERARVSENELVNLPARWDAFWYLSIAEHGYQWDGNPQREQNVVFFPGLPLLMRVVGLFLGEQWLVAALAIALGSFLLALVYLHRLAAEFMDRERADAAVWALAAYPFAVYYSAPYTESLYLLGTAAIFLHLAREQWWQAGGWGLWVGLCRPNGFFLAIPAAIVVIRYVIRQRRLPVAAVLACAAPIAGALIYSTYLYVRFGDPLVWLKGQAAWRRVFVGVWPGVRSLIVERYTQVAEHGWYHYTSTNPYDVLYTAAALFALISIWPCIRRFGLEYGAFVAINILPPLVMGGLMSIGRMTAVLFPAFLWLGASVAPARMRALIAAFCVFQGLMAALFFTWRPVF